MCSIIISSIIICSSTISSSIICCCGCISIGLCLCLCLPEINIITDKQCNINPAINLMSYDRTYELP